MAAATITGTVFRDYNGNGVLDINEPGIGGVTITAFDSAGGSLATTSSSASATLGQYTISYAGADTALRLEMTGLPTNFQPGFASGAVSNTSVRFVTDGDSADFGIYMPRDYCDNPQIVTSCFIPGDNSIVTDPTIIFYDYFTNARYGAFTESPLAVANQVGATYGLAYQFASESLFAGSFVRRGAGQGSTDSTGTIYRVSDVFAATPTVAPFIDLNGLAGIDTGTNPHPNGTATADFWITDPAGFSSATKVGLGDLEISEDERTLYTMNLFQRELIVIPLDSAGANPTPPTAGQLIRRPVPTPATCVAADVRPFGIKYQDGLLYVGMICSGESELATILAGNATPTFAEIATARDAMRAYVYTFDPTTNTFAGTPTLDFPLNYPRGQVNDGFASLSNDGEWLPWNDEWRPSYAPDSGGLFANPQPVLTDIEFDGLGYMMLGFRDRFADQAFSSGDISPTGTEPGTQTRQGGDLLLACLNPTSGNWELETGGVCQGRGPTTQYPLGTPQDQGPGNAEFYSSERYDPYHEEISLGGLGLLPGSGEIVTSVFDSWDAFENGTQTYSNTDATLIRRAQVFAPNTLFRKGGGLGDIEFICNSTPIQIGNRVWRDDNQNGIQDPGEVPLAGVEVQLFSPTNTLLGTAITGLDGSYYFSSGSGTDTTNAIYNVTGLTPNTTGFEVRINPTSVTNVTALAGLSPTTANADATTNGDVRDSDGVLTGGNIVAPFDTGGIGANNHTYDFGFTAVTYSLGNRVWLDSDGNGTDNGATEPGVTGVTVRLLDGTGTPVDNPNVAGVQDYTVTTNAEGYYRFDGLPAGTYIVEIVAANFGTGQPLAGTLSTTTGATSENVDQDDNGVDDAAPATNGIRSVAVTLNDTENTGDPSNAPTETLAQTGVAADNRYDATVDFGFTAVTYSLGNRVWLDSDGNGTDNAATEPGVTGVTVRLLDGTGTPVDNPNVVGVQDYTVTTNAEGYYRFDGLPAGTYIVEIVAANFGTGQPLAGTLSTTTGATSENVDQDDNGVDDAAPGTNGIRSVAITLNDTENTGDPSNAPTETLAQTGVAADNRYDATVDFGFVVQTYSLGNRVWLDSDGNGTDNGATELGVTGVTVRLLDGTGTPVDNPNVVGVQDYTVTTNAEGYYRFDGLPAGTYIVEVVAANFGTGQPLANTLSTTTGATSENVDQDDNGVDDAAPGTNGIRSVAVTLNDTENTGDPSNAPTETLAQTGVAADNRYDATVDFGFVVQTYSLGNRVWLDSNGNGTDNGATEPGVAGVTVRLLDGTGTPVDNPNVAGVQDYTVTTNADGYYRFDGLPAGTYIVEVVAANFGTGQPLAGTLSTTTGATSENVDQDDNGVDDAAPGTNGIRSVAITLNDTENTGDPSNAPTETLAQTGVAPDARYDATVDFGFVVQTYSLGNRVWLDSDGNGTDNGATEPGVTGVTVRLLDGTGTPVDNPNVAGVQDYTVTTNAEGYYRFDGLASGTYIVEIVAANFGTGQPLAGTLSTTTGATSENVDQDDNGVDDAAPGTNGIRSVAITLNDTENTGDPSNAPTETLAQTGVAPDARYDATVDFGFVVQTYSLGNRVWLDSNGDGTDNGATEPGVAGVTVRLLDGTGTPVDNPNVAGVQDYTVTTNTEGYYRFDGLPAGTYIVEIVAANFGTGQPLANTLSTTTGATSENVDQDDNGVDDAAPATNGIRSVVITLNDTENTGDPSNAPTETLAQTGAAPDARYDATVDFGFVVQTYSLGNRVWLDSDGNGTDNGATEPGVTGVTVRLLDGTGTPVDNPNVAGVQDYTVTTNTEGYYRFDGLPAGTYIVEVVAANFGAGQPLANTLSTTTGATSENVDQDDNGVDDAAPATNGIRSVVITLNDTENTGDPSNAPTETLAQTGVAPDARYDATVDFGFVVQTYSLGNRVWLDSDGNGTDNGATEPGVTGVTVRLLDGTGTPVDNPNVVGVQDYTVTTNAEGYYRFDGLPAGTYIVEIVAANFGAGQPLANSLSTTTGATSENVDQDDNGVDDAAPATNGIRSVAITLNDTENTGDPSNAPTETLAQTGVAADNRYDATVDFGFVVQTYSLGNRVWLDSDGNGTDNGATEPGVAGATVRLLDGAGTPVDNPNVAGVQDYTVTTNTEGYYRFDGLPAGTYIVEVLASNFGTGQPLANTLSTTTGVTSENVDQDDNGVDDAAPGTNGIRSVAITLNDTENTGDPSNAPTETLAQTGVAPDARYDATVDFGFIPGERVAIGSLVWLDNDANGQFGAGDTPVVGVTVQLYASGANPGVDAPLTSTTTDAAGHYFFDQLAPASYFVYIPAANFGVGQPLEGTVSSAGAGTDETTDETGDENGQDAFVNGGIRSNDFDLQPNSEPTDDDDTGYPGTLDDDNVNLTDDFGFIANPNPLSLGNRVWIDANNDGIRQDTETPIDGVTVQLFVDANGDGVPDGAAMRTTTTGGGGYYLFDNLTPGTYIVGIPASNFGAAQPLENYLSSTGTGQEATPNSDVDDNDNGIDVSNPSVAGILSGPVTLTVGGEPITETDLGTAGSGTAANPDSNLTVDFGFFVPAADSLSLGNRVWIDTDNSGTLDGSEAGIGGVQLTLYSVVGGVRTPIATTTTDGSGYYLFVGLLPGDYVVGVDASNFQPGGALEGSLSSSGAGQEADPENNGDNNDNGIDDANPAANGIFSNPITLALGSEPDNEVDTGSGTGGVADTNSNLTLDFGFTTPVAPTPAPVPTAQPPSATALPQIFDPGISKVGDPTLAQPGELVEWTITVTNPHSIDLSNVSFTDSVSDQLIVLGASASAGTVNVSGQTVTFNIGTLPANSVVIITVQTRVRNDVVPPFTITNDAVLNGPYTGSASAIVNGVAALPATGETPWWRNWLLPLILGGLAAGGVYGTQRRLRRNS